MASGWEVLPENIPFFLAGGGMFLLAGLLLWLNFGDRLNRAFALVLVARGGINLAGAFVADPPRRTPSPESALAGALQIHFFILLLCALAWFFAVLATHYAQRRPPRWALPSVALAGLVLDATFILDPSLWRVQTAEGFAIGAMFGLAQFTLIYSSVVWLLAREYARGERPRRALLLVAWGFALYPAFNLFDSLFADPLAYFARGEVPAATAFEALTQYPVPYYLSWIPLLLFLREARRGDAKFGRSDTKRIGTTLALAGATGAVAGIVYVWPGGAIRVMVYDALDGIWTFAMACSVAYALLRHQLFDIDVKLRWTLNRGTLAGIFLAVFFVTTQLAQNYLSVEYGWALGGVAAGLMLFAIAPLQAAADRIAGSVFPQGRPAAALSDAERRALYREQALVAWEDGVLSRDERRMLEASRQRLGLTRDEAAHIESEAATAVPHG